MEEASLKDIVKNDYQGKTIVDLNIPDNKIGIASDHRGFKLKQKLTKYLTKKGYTVIDYGCDDRASHDYPEYGFKLGKAVRDNKVEKVRCAKVNNIKEAKYTRTDNDANIIAINGNMPLFRAKDITDVFLKTPFSNQERHQRRIEMLDNYKN